MEPNERERFTDELLDAALRQYSVEPRAGLEQRVLAGVRAKENETTQPWWRWQWVAVAAAAALVIALGIYLAVPREVPTREPLIADKPAITQPSAPAPSVTPAPAAPAPRETATAPKSSPRRAVAAVVAASVAAPLTKLDVFPAPAPISEQEQVALFYARRAPAQALVAAAEASRRPLTALLIEEIQVAPLAEPQGTEQDPQDGIQK